MSTQLKLRRGTTAQHSTFTGAEGEVTVDTTKDTLIVHDGTTAGGVPLMKESGSTAGANFATTSGNVGIGTSSPAEKLDVSGNIRLSGSDTYIKFINPGGYDFSIRSNNGNNLEFYSPEYSANPLMAITNNGNVGIGTSSPTVKLDVNGIVGGSGSGFNPGTTAWVSAAFKGTGSYGGGISFVDGSNGATIYAGGANLIFGNGATSGGTLERARIDSSGNLLVGITSNAYNYVRKSSAGNYVFGVENTANINGDATYKSKLGANCNTTSSYHLVCDVNGIDKMYIQGNGNIINVNNSYGALSDVKLKENVVDATPKLEKLNQVRIVNYNLKTDPDQKLIGVVAQELEQVFPGMVDETPDRDAEGNDLGTTTKSVKYSVFVPMLIKAMQEQQTLITALTARIDILEQGGV